MKRVTIQQMVDLVLVETWGLEIFSRFHICRSVLDIKYKSFGRNSFRCAILKAFLKSACMSDMIITYTELINNNSLL